MERIIGVNSNCYHGYSIEDALEGIHNAGFKYIELTATKGWTEHVFPDMSISYLNTIKDKMEQLDIKPFALSGHCNLMDKNRLKDFVSNMQLADFFGCDYIVSSIGEAHIVDKEIVTMDMLIENIKSLIPSLKKYELKLALELHGEYNTGSILKKIVDLVDSNLVIINYDTANAIFYGNVDPAEDICTCIDELGYMHLKDKSGKNGEWNFPALGYGNVNFKKIFAKLVEEKKNCPFSIEIEFTPKGPKDLKEVNEAVKASYSYLKALGFEI